MYKKKPALILFLCIFLNAINAAGAYEKESIEQAPPHHEGLLEFLHRVLGPHHHNNAPASEYPSTNDNEEIIDDETPPREVSLAPHSSSPDQKKTQPHPYDNALLQLADNLGALQFLTNLCGKDNDKFWLEKMDALLKAQNPSLAQRLELVAAFNNAYRSFATNYRSCTTSAQEALNYYNNQVKTIINNLLQQYSYADKD